MSANYNFLNIDSFEFEQLCSEILSIYLNKDFTVFAQGPDGGVDIKQRNGNEEIIAQAKRYKDVKTCFSEELEKISKKPDCKKYYLFVACPLSPERKKKIFETFQNYMDDESFIFDSISINSFLDRDEYFDIVKNHFRLWATSEKVFRVLTNNSVNADTKTFLNNVKRHQQFYVETSDFRSALKMFEDNRIILLKGNPGVGKTTTSEMMVLSFLNKYPGANFIYSASSNINEIKSALSNNPEVKELVFIDDFLGDIYLDLRGEKMKNITSFIDYFKNFPNKYLIINSRIVILQQANTNYIDFRKSIAEVGIKEIELNNLSKKDKANILYNHIYFSDIDDKDKKEFLDRKLYKTIVEHEHYSPRLIEVICNKKQFELNGTDFVTYVNMVLEQQLDTWAHAYKNNLDDPDRLLLLVLYSFNLSLVKVTSLQRAFIFEAKRCGKFDLSIDLFGESLRRLSGSFVNIVFFGDIKFVQFINPSVKDLLDKIDYFDFDSEFCFFEQYLFVYGQKEFMQSPKLEIMMRNGSVNNLHFERTDVKHVFALYFFLNKKLDLEFENFYLDALTSNLQSSYSKIAEFYVKDIFKELISEHYLNFYNLKKLGTEQALDFALNCVANIDLSKLDSIFSYLEKNVVTDIINDCDLKDAIIESCYGEYDKTDAIENGKFYIDYGGEPIQEFDEETAKEYAVSEIFSEVDFKCSMLSLNYGLTILESEVSDAIPSSDFKVDSGDYHESYDNDDNWDDSDSSDCYSIFENLLR